MRCMEEPQALICCFRHLGGQLISDNDPPAVNSGLNTERCCKLHGVQQSAQVYSPAVQEQKVKGVSRGWVSSHQVTHLCASVQPLLLETREKKVSFLHVSMELTSSQGPKPGQS